MVLRWIFGHWIRVALWFRFRKLQVEFHSPLDLKQGAILAANHQNAILDTMTVAALSPKVPFTLSRGSLFQNPLARWFLGSLRLLPVYRFRDGFKRMRRNQEMFGEFVDVLARDEWLLVFAEGSHFLGFTLRPVQKGTARIAFSAQEAQGWTKEIPIIPVGLQYESHTDFGSRLLVQFGPPVSTSMFEDLFRKSPKEAERALTAKLFEEMRRLVVVFPPDPQAYAATLDAWRRSRGRFPDLVEQFRADKERFEGESASGGGEDPGPTERRRRWRKASGLVLSLPGIFLHLPVLLIILAWERLFIRDVHLMPAARFAEGMFLFPVWYLLGTVFGYLMTGSWIAALSFLILMPASLWLWSRTWHWV